MNGFSGNAKESKGKGSNIFCPIPATAVFPPLILIDNYFLLQILTYSLQTFLKQTYIYRSNNILLN